jgi:hypothetical protein
MAASQYVFKFSEQFTDADWDDPLVVYAGYPKLELALHAHLLIHASADALRNVHEKPMWVRFLSEIDWEDGGDPWRLTLTKFMDFKYPNNAGGVLHRDTGLFVARAQVMFGLVETRRTGPTAAHFLLALLTTFPKGAFVNMRGQHKELLDLNMYPLHTVESKTAAFLALKGLLGNDIAPVYDWIILLSIYYDIQLCGRSYLRDDEYSTVMFTTPRATPRLALRGAEWILKHSNVPFFLDTTPANVLAFLALVPANDFKTIGVTLDALIQWAQPPRPLDLVVVRITHAMDMGTQAIYNMCTQHFGEADVLVLDLTTLKSVVKSQQATEKPFTVGPVGLMEA